MDNHNLFVEAESDALNYVCNYKFYCNVDVLE